MPMDEKAKKKREKNSKQSDDELAQKYMAEVTKRFKHGKQIDYVFLDSCFDKEDPEEKRCFDQAMDKLLNALNAAKPLPTSKVQEVATEKAALRREIAEKESAARASDPVGERARGRCKEACGPREATSSGKPQCRK